MSRSYKDVRLKDNLVYSRQDLMNAYRVTNNTISNWIAYGLRSSDCQRPMLFRGAIVNWFHASRERALRKHLRSGEFKCWSCKQVVFPRYISVDPTPSNSGSHSLSSICPNCSKRLSKFGTQSDLDLTSSIADPNSTADCSDEAIRESPSAVGKCHARNDRLIYAWQDYSGRYAANTIASHLRAIRSIEAMLDGKPFDKLTTRDVAYVRERLKQQLKGPEHVRRSRSTVSHAASHIRAFLKWLVEQPAGRKLPKDLPDYIDLPRSVYAECLPRPSKPYPSIEKAEKMLTAMPSRSYKQKRDRAVFAFAFLGALRADTLVTLRLKHIDAKNKLIIQDGTVSRTKNGKCLEIWWFPIPEAFAVEAQNWVDLMGELWFQPDDPLFPDLKYLNNGFRRRNPNAPPIPPMRSKVAVKSAFEVACLGETEHFTPHAAKHTIASLRDQKRLTSIQRKAWSENMGHDTEQITDRHYGKLSPEDRRDAIAQIDAGNDECGVLDCISDEELGAEIRRFLKRRAIINA